MSQPRKDLLGRSFPPGGEKDPAQRVAELYAAAEAEAERTVAWYLADRRRKRRSARALRIGVIVGVTAGAALPLFRAPAALGYLALLAAAACLGCDRYLGLTAGWMRSVATAQAVRRRLEGLHHDWAAEAIREADGTVAAGEAAERRLAVLRRFSEDVTELLRAETVVWMAEQGGLAPALLAQPQAPAAPRPAESAGPRSLGHSAVRPNMPRQRPPDGPR